MLGETDCGLKVTLVGKSAESLLPYRFVPLFAIGLPIPIYFNGIEVDRPFAINAI